MEVGVLYALDHDEGSTVLFDIDDRSTVIL